MKEKDHIAVCGRPRVMSLTEPMETVGDCQPKTQKTIRNIDADDSANQFACAEYANEIYIYWQKCGVCLVNLLVIAENFSFSSTLVCHIFLLL